MSRLFVQGLDLSGLFYEEAVKPILATHYAALLYSAALLGHGSEVLGFDTPQSMDHDWGPRLLLFLLEADYPEYHEQIDRVLRQELPNKFHGYPTNLAIVGGDRIAETPVQEGPVDHSVLILTVRSFFRHLLDFDPDEELRVVDWLSFPQHYLRCVTAGRVFHDGLGALELVRARLHYYPYDVWLYLLAAQWRRIGQEEAFMGRCAQVGDELGSRLVAARLVRDLMRLGFLMERQYTPYLKWLGTAFAQLHCAKQLNPIFLDVMKAGSWKERERYLSTAYQLVAHLHNELGITEPLSTQVAQYYKRPFQVIHADRFVDAIRAAITSEEVRALPLHLGSIDQFTDSTDALDYVHRFRAMYGREG